MVYRLLIKSIYNRECQLIQTTDKQITTTKEVYGPNGKTVNTRNISGMLLCSKKKANQAWFCG